MLCVYVYACVFTCAYTFCRIKCPVSSNMFKNDCLTMIFFFSQIFQKQHSTLKGALWEKSSQQDWLLAPCISPRDFGTTTDLWPTPGNLALKRLMLMVDSSVVYTWSKRPCSLRLSGIFCRNIKTDDVHQVIRLWYWVLLSLLIVWQSVPNGQLSNKSLPSGKSPNLSFQFPHKEKTHPIQWTYIWEDLKNPCLASLKSTQCIASCCSYSLSFQCTKPAWA